MHRHNYQKKLYQLYHGCYQSVKLLIQVDYRFTIGRVRNFSLLNHFRDYTD